MTVRPMLASDAGRVAELSGQLGYPAEATEVAERFRALAADPLSALLVAEDADGRVVGWTHVLGRQFLESAASAEVMALVVDADLRRSGVGRQLLAAAESWAVARGYDLMRIRSNTVRQEARPFYLGRGYEIAKTQYVFSKRLG
jgi:GNAT superfamily N-acetyltransferase